MKCEFNDAGVFGSRGCFAGVTLLRRALGSSGESGRPSCSAVQHRRDAIAESGDHVGERKTFEELLRFGGWPCGVVAKHRKGRRAHHKVDERTAAGHKWRALAGKYRP